MLGSLLTFLGWKFQSPDVSLFDIHGAIMLLLIIDVCIFTISMAVTILPSFNRIHLPFFKGVFLISGVVASDLILLMLAPPFGWFIFTICASVMILLLYRSRREILQHCQEILKPMWHSTSEAFHVSNQSGQHLPKHPMDPQCLPNMKEKHVLGSVNNVSRNHMFLI
ncbi:hypothetical protein RGQ29_010716 [Quercus rubra]|uniref:Uncharacterized protein n=1 Tax=Quercus rubra TaxID=3512 RepID=A0AAN7FVK8_QUERU|nr:hypothetical protein RGQ29_010716 [Quercus rubra]